MSGSSSTCNIRALGDFSAVILTLVTRHTSLVTTNDFSAHFTEPDPVTVAFAPTGNRKSVAIFQPFAFFAARQFQWIRAAPGQLEHAASRFLGLAAYGSAREQ